MPEQLYQPHISIVLHRPLIPENIGSTARAMSNMGFSHLIVVDPKSLDKKRMMMMATRGGAHVIETMCVYDTLKEAVAPFNYIIGTTARLGGQRRALLSPEAMARKLVNLVPNNRIALVFGPEDSGLSNEDLRHCHELVSIPTAGFSSLNLSQAVLVLCYEIFKLGIEEKQTFTPRLANRYELMGMYDQLRDILVRICYINPENPDYWLANIRHFFTRIQLRAKEVGIIRGIIRQMNWYAEKRYRDGLMEGKKGESQ